ncbi:hypothetical protein ACOSQ2_027584 [Xanthoceras sorbifolium]
MMKELRNLAAQGVCEQHRQGSLVKGMQVGKISFYLLGVKESTEYLRGGIEYSDRIRVHASRPEQIGGVGYRSHISHQVA